MNNGHVTPPRQLRDDAFDVEMTLRFSSTGLDEHALDMMGDVRRFVSLQVRPCEIVEATIERSRPSLHDSIDVRTIPIKKM